MNMDNGHTFHLPQISNGVCFGILVLAVMYAYVNWRHTAIYHHDYFMNVRNFIGSFHKTFQTASVNDYYLSYGHNWNITLSNTFYFVCVCVSCELFVWKEYLNPFQGACTFYILSFAHVFLFHFVGVSFFQVVWIMPNHECRFHLFSSSSERWNVIFWYCVLCLFHSPFILSHIKHKIALSLRRALFHFYHLMWRNL